MKFEVRYPSGAVHMVEYPGPLVSVGRDPTCDLVLNDSKCSRRHAVMEAGPSGLAVRDTGSANGIFLNGKKVERGILQDGDLVRMGEVIIKVLAEPEPEPESGTLIVAEEELQPLPPLDGPARSSSSLTTTEVAGIPAGPVPRAGPPPKMVTPPSRREAAAPPRTGPGTSGPAAGKEHPAADAREPIPRPLTVTVLSLLWAAAGAAFAAGGLVSASLMRWNGLLSLSVAVGGLAAAAVAAVLALGLWARSPWARPMQIAVAALGLLTCTFLPTAATTLIYMLRAETRAAFSGAQELQDLEPAEAEALRVGSAEAAFGLSILAMVVLGAVLTGLLGWLWAARRQAMA